MLIVGGGSIDLYSTAPQCGAQGCCRWNAVSRGAATPFYDNSPIRGKAPLTRSIECISVPWHAL